MKLVALPFFLFAAAVSAGSSDPLLDAICSPEATGYMGNKLAVVCYTGNFLTKMLSELNEGDVKTREHVRSNLLPYLAGQRAIDLLPEEQKTGLTGLRNRLTAEQQGAYDSLKACHKELTNRVLDALPQVPPCSGGTLLPDRRFPDRPVEQVVHMFGELFASSEYDERSCKVGGGKKMTLLETVRQ
eukprot:GDKI01044136.1.p1 GENE.GDKI01044136.1~~GDKI01044136.1.p1  ORF type:complete len:186 (+),score=45.71 GDKI01044136.1:52-609(+)